MNAIWYKNICYFRHNKSELFMQLINSAIQICPIYIMIYSNHSNNKENYYVIFSYLIACLILDIAIGVCFEYYREIIANKNVDLILADVDKIKYAFTQGLFYLILNLWILIIVAIGIFSLNPFEMDFSISIINICLLIISNIFFVCSLCVISAGLAFLIDKTKVFSIGSLVCNVMLIFSGCYASINEFPVFSYFLFYFNPFYYYVNLTQYFLLGTTLRNNIYFMILGDFLLTTCLLYIGKKIQDKKK